MASALPLSGKIVTVVGGTGFLGRYVVRLLAKEGYVVRVISRDPEAARLLRTCGEVGQIVLTRGSLTKFDSIANQLAGSYAVVNLAGILFEGGSQKFHAVHAQGAEKLAKAAKSAGAKAFVHVSALGVDKAATSAYARTKVVGEKAVRGAFHDAAILRPSVLFGPEDNFFNQFARMAAMGPTLPLIGGGKTRFQPVYVGDVARAILECIRNPETRGKTYELGGPDIFTFRQILEYILQETSLKRPFTPLPFKLAGAIGMACELMPRPRLTRDQVRLLKYDNVVSPDAKTFAELRIAPTPVSAIVPQYLARYNAHARKAA